MGRVCIRAFIGVPGDYYRLISKSANPVLVF